MKYFLQPSLHLLLFFLNSNLAVYFEKADIKEGDKVQVILEEHSPSLLACTHLCTRAKGDTLFNHGVCKCVKTSEGEGSSTDEVMGTTLTGQFYKKANKKRNDCKCGFGRGTRGTILKMYENLDDCKRCQMLCSLLDGCRSWLYVPEEYSDKVQIKRCYLRDRFELTGQGPFYYGKPCN